MTLLSDRDVSHLFQMTASCFTVFWEPSVQALVGIVSCNSYHAPCTGAMQLYRSLVPCTKPCINNHAPTEHTNTVLTAAKYGAAKQQCHANLACTTSINIKHQCYELTQCINAMYQCMYQCHVSMPCINALYQCVASMQCINAMHQYHATTPCINSIHQYHARTPFFCAGHQCPCTSAKYQRYASVPCYLRAMLYACPRAIVSYKSLLFSYVLKLFNLRRLTRCTAFDKLLYIGRNNFLNSKQ
jgi:hypothetical protein